LKRILEHYAHKSFFSEFSRLPLGSEKWTFINVQNGKTFFQFGTTKYRSLELSLI